MQKTYHPLYKLDSKGRTRVWYMEQNGDQFRTFDGVFGGTVKPSGWKTAKPTNVGRSNERDGIAQATFEIEARYTKQLKGAYYDDVADIHLGCRYFEPMLAETYGKHKNAAFEPGYAQPKLDGMRAIAQIRVPFAQPMLFSREGDPVAGTAHIVEALDPLFAADPGFVLDGELYNHELKDNFNELMSLAKKANPSPERAAQIRDGIQYHVYDLPSHRGGFGERSELLEQLLEQCPSCIRIVPTLPVGTEAEFDALHVRWINEGYEGSVLRRNAAYENDRTFSLLKRKDFDEEEFDIVRIEEGEGNWAGAAKRVICWLPGADQSLEPANDNTFEAGLRGTYGANAALLADADNQKVVSIRYFGWTPSAIPKPRFGVATRFHGAARNT